MPYKDIQKRRDMQMTRWKKRQEWLWSKKIACSRCSENHPAALDFHHVDQSNKVIGITEALRKNWSFSRIEEELEKCIVLCANCHRKEHNALIA